MSRLQRDPGPGITLPFRPFTPDEVQRLTGASPKDIDEWMRTRLKPHMGSGAVGLDWMQAFAAFVGRRWQDEGARATQVGEVISYVASISLDFLLGKFALGLSFPALPSIVGKGCPGKGMMIAPPETALGRALDLRPMLLEFRARMAEVFPNG